MSRVILLVLLCAALAPRFATVASAQDMGGAAQSAQQQYHPPGEAGALAQPINGPPAPDPADFVLLEDGMIVVDGDTNTHCRWFASDLQQGYHRTLDQELARSVLERCERAGFSVSSAQEAALPDTGGPTPSLRAAVGMSLLMGLGALATVAQQRSA